MSSELFVHLFHILFVGSLFIYIGIKQKTMAPWVFKMLALLGIFVIIFHVYKAHINFTEKRALWVNLFHILIIGPLLIAIGLHGEKAPRYLFELIFMLGFAVVGYHGYYLAIGH